VREPIGFTFEQSAKLQDNFNLRNLIDGYGRIKIFNRMPHSILKVLLELEITNIESFKIVVEVKARKPFILGPRGFL
jgi:hypothetical protein